VKIIQTGKGEEILAVRPIFLVSENKPYCEKQLVEFQFYSGFSDTQKRKSINSFHQAFLLNNSNAKILEISSKSESELGISLSAFNLMIETKTGKKYSVESAFQASKVFQSGGPYKDLLDVSSINAKRDERLKNSGKLLGFNISGKNFELEPKTYFYNWLYINTLNMHENLAEQIQEYDCFTDIAFNPQKSINCQAEAAAIYVSLCRKKLLSSALKNKDSFLEIVYGERTTNYLNEQYQFSLWDI
jgi:type I restriction enzyme M protein